MCPHRENHDRLIWIASRHEVHPTRLVDEKYVLHVVQEIWTSMWMHESLEAFVLITPEYQLTLPLDPHCWDKLEIKPSHMGFLTDSQCQPVSVYNPLKVPLAHARENSFRDYMPEPDPQTEIPTYDRKD